jgi:UTP--glucose-1-phosphate uridylyltransferase
MRAAGVPAPAIAVFRHAYLQLEQGESGLLTENALEPVADLPALADLPAMEREAADALRRTVVLKVNGGLGTTMGLDRPRSLLQVKDGCTFLDVIVRQVLALRQAHGARLPLLLMNSFATRDESIAALRSHPEIGADVPLDFLQHREPKLRADDLMPVTWDREPGHEWCPPGHGDLYPALATSGVLDALLERGYRYAFVSNADNLGAAPDLRIMGWFAAENIPFLLEACERTEADRKGGHLALLRGDGRLVLRESAQTAPEDEPAFQDVRRHRYFNTNNLWLSLPHLAQLLRDRNGVLGLPLIRNRKRVDPSDPSSPEVFQLESAMGAAISVFEGSRAVLVGRDRFVPVKTTNDLLAVRSDAYELDEMSRLVVSRSRRTGKLFVDLDRAFYGMLPALEARFPDNPPSLVECERFVVRGDVRFGPGVVARGQVEVAHAGPGQLVVEAGTALGA